MTEKNSPESDATRAPSDSHAPKVTHGGRVLPSGSLVLLRHGPTEWSENGRHTGVTDLPLTEYGEEVSRSARPMVEGFDFAEVLVSPRTRARRTAELLGLTPTAIDDNLVEWDYGGYEGITTPQIREQVGYDWTVWEDGVVPGETPGETIEDVAARARDVINRVLPTLKEGRDVALVAHGHFLRVLAATWLREDLRFGEALVFDAGAVSVLGYERTRPALLMWNAKPFMPGSTPGTGKHGH